MKYSIAIILSVLLVLTFSEAEALRNDSQEIIKEIDNFDAHITVSEMYLTENRLESIKEVIYDDEILSIEDHWMHKGPRGHFTDYYLGWELALNQVQETKLTFEVNNNPGDIHIKLVKHKSKNSGVTWTQGDDVFIMIFDIDRLTPNSLQTILRHELGHAFGLGHNSGPEELMHERIDGYYPYISSCNIQALLYNNQTEIRCEK